MTVGADTAYYTKGFVKACREMNVTPHVAQNVNRSGGSAIDGRTMRHVGYEVIQRMRKSIEQCFGWVKVIGPIRQMMVQGLDKVDRLLTLTMAAYNLTRLRALAQLGRRAPNERRNGRNDPVQPQESGCKGPIAASLAISTGCMTSNAT